MASSPAQAALLQRRQRSLSASSSSSAAPSTLGPLSSAASSIRSLSPLGRPAGPWFRRRRSSRSRNTAAAARARKVAFASAILSALCAGSITVFSLYGHIFQSRLRYTQFEVNGVAIAGSVSSYLPVPLLGYLCDRIGPAPLSLASAGIFATGYSLAATVFAHVDDAVRNGRPPHNSLHSGTVTGGPISYALMISAFVCIGVGTASMYLSAVATCAKNFGTGKHRGLALAMPIAAFGLSGMWQSQVGSRVLYERLGDGNRGDVDVFRFFIFLAVVLAIAGVIGFFCLRIVNEDELIDEAVEELERSGLLTGSALFTPGGGRIAASAGGYGTMGTVVERSNPFEDPAYVATGGSDDFNSSSDDTAVNPDGSTRDIDPSSKGPDEEAALLASEQRVEDMQAMKKEWVLNAETRRFLTDHTMWLFAAGFFFMVGPGEAFINNMGTVIKTLYPPAAQGGGGQPLTTVATHVSIIGITSTIARLATGTLTDLLAPSPGSQHIQLTSSQMLERHPTSSGCFSCRPSISRVSFLLFSAALLSAGLATLASGVAQGHGDRFWIVSSLVGAGYGAVFSLTPIIITVIWGVENFATNWGIVATMPALGATMWGLIYSAVYEAGASAAARSRSAETAPQQPGHGGDGGDIFCYGTVCYATTFWAMSASVWVACVLVVLAWKGRNGWAQRGIVI
ncbi:hypothetical protein RB597_009804 [Gaeumannomyces tritici]